MRHLALSLAVLTVAVAALVRPTAAAAAPKVSYKPPVDGPIVDPFRPPPEPWLAGNRGIDYRPAPGTPVQASGDGEVVFAGQVGGGLHVVVLHADGVRTSYSFLDSIAVGRGDRVRQGQVVGTSGEGLHFGARVGDTYIDPRTLFDGGPSHVFLVPDEVRRAGTVAEERSGLSRFLAGLKRVGSAVATTAWDMAWSEAYDRTVGEALTRIEQLKALAHYQQQFTHVARAVRLARTTLDWWRQRDDCTPAGVAPPPLPERRVAVLVAGLGSTSGRDSVDHVRPGDLGYDDHVRFSYLGGSTTEQAYARRDTTTDLRTEARRLRELLEQVHREHPGVPVDIIAHSQGGIIARTALAYEWDTARRSLPPVANLVTLASPHQGTDAATALTLLDTTDSGSFVFDALDSTRLSPFDLGGDSIHQLSETSTFIADLNRRALPDGVRFTSIGSRGDWMVPSVHTAAPGARNVVVNAPGAWKDHSGLPGSDEGRREVRLAVAGLPPTCQTWTDMMADTIVSDAIATTEDVLGAAAFAGAMRLDRRIDDLDSPQDRDRPAAGGPDGLQPERRRQEPRS